MPFAPAPSFDYELPPLPEGRRQALPSASLFSDALEDLGEGRQVYCLALVDEETGAALRPATEADVEKLLLDADEEGPPEEAAPAKEVPLQALLASTSAQKGPVCMHCAATESPQWRRGPPNKPLLCNACGTRFRRTNQLGPAAPSTANRKRVSHGCAREVAAAAEPAGKGRAMKQPRMVA